MLNVERRKIGDRGQWLEDRRPLLTASDIGAAAGLDPYKTRLDLHLEKIGARQPVTETPPMKRGRILEAAAVEYIREELTGWRLLRPAVLLIDHEHRIGATPDLLLEDPDAPEHIVNCQIKVVGKPTFEGWDGEPPAGYQLQVAMESMLLDAHSGVLAVLVLTAYDAQLHMFPVPRHPAAEAKILEIAAEFWHRVDNGIMPAADYERDGETVRALYPPDKAKPAPLDLASDNRIYALLEDREAHKAAEKAAVAECDAIDAEIIEKLAGSELAIANGWKITRRVTHRKEYTVEAKDIPVLRVAKTKEEAT